MACVSDMILIYSRDRYTKNKANPTHAAEQTVSMKS